MVQFLFDGGDAARVPAFDDVDQALRQLQLPFFDDLAVADDVDGDGVVDVAEYVQVEFIDRAFDLDDVFFTHFIAVRVLDDRNAAVHAVELQVTVEIHAFAGLDVIEHDAFVQLSYV